MANNGLFSYFGWADRPEKAYFLGTVVARNPAEAMAKFSAESTAIIYGRKVQSAIIVERNTKDSFQRNKNLGLL